PLIDASGRVIGVNADIATGNTGNDGNVGIGFAIPVNTVRDVADQLIQFGKAIHPYIGVSVQAITPDVVRLFALPVRRGVLVQQVFAGSPAAKAGVKGGSTGEIVQGESYVVGGDVITNVDGIPVTSETRFRDLIAAKKPGDTVTLRLYRGGSQLTLAVRVGR